MCETFKHYAVEVGAVAEIEVIRLYDPFTLAEDSQVVVLAVQAAKCAGLKAMLGATGGGSDANIYNRYGVPCAVLGIGMQKSHTTEECIKEEDLYQTAKLVVEIIKAVARVQKE